MAIGTADRDILVQALFDIVGEDYYMAARILARLETRFPAVAWRSRLNTLMNGRPEYTASGLSIDWWKSEVARLADIHKVSPP
jgi:hypothetical protein